MKKLPFAAALFLSLFLLKAERNGSPEGVVLNMYNAIKNLDGKVLKNCFLPEEGKIAETIIRLHRKEKMREKGEMIILRKKYTGNECEVLTEKKGELFSKESCFLKKVQGKWRIEFIKTLKKGYSEPALKRRCKGNLSQLMLALRMYEDRCNTLPPKGWQSLLEKKFIYSAELFHCPADGKEYIYKKVPLDKEKTVELKAVAYCPFHKDPETGRYLHVLFSSREVKSGKINK